MLKHENFASRVQTLRDTWVERRQVGQLASAHDFDSQFRLLQTLHNWAGVALADVQGVYGETLPLALSPMPEQSDDPPAFSLVVDTQHSLTLSLSERRRMGAARGHLGISVSAAGAAHASANAGPERRNGQWTRARLEDLILSLLGAYERSLHPDSGRAGKLGQIEGLEPLPEQHRPQPRRAAGAPRP
jgi:hypothetical protein